MTRPTIDDLEMLNPFELGKLLLAEVQKFCPDFQFIQDLIAVGCPIDARDESLSTALHFASWHGYLDVAKILISNGVEVDARDIKGRTALHYATGENDLEVARFLISRGAQLDAREKWGRTPLHYAALKMEILVYNEDKAEVDGVDEYGRIDVDVSSMDRQLEMVKFLISIGAEVNAGDNWSQTAWDLAVDEIRGAIPELEPQ